MTTYVLRRLAQIVPTLFVVSLVVFGLMRLVPGDPAQVFAGQDATAAQIDIVRREFGLDRPVHVQYLIWLRRLLVGDLGVSYHTGRSVRELVTQKLAATIELTLAAMAIALAIGIPASVVAALRRKTAADHLATVTVLVGLSLPSFCLGIVLILVFAMWLHLLPPIGYVPFQESPGRNLRFLVLPALTLGIILAAPIMRFMRAGMLDVLLEDYVRTARAKGLRERAVVTRHVFRNAALPTLTMVGLQVGELLGGTAGVEVVFAWPGVGRLMADSIFQRDYAVIQVVVLFLAVTFVVINLLVDVLYARLDPRIRLG
jgi:peptide/nickel transport system permease protein